MKITKFIISIIVIIQVMNFNSISFAKYVYDYTLIAAEINIDNSL